MRIITISRRFGSGGRELAEKLAKNLGFAYYDRNIITEIAKKTSLSERFITDNIEKSFTAYPTHFGRGSFYSPLIDKNAIAAVVAQKSVMTELAAKSDAVFVGRAADVILAEFKPFNIFVCAERQARIERCRNRVQTFAGLSDREILKQMDKVDAERAKCRRLYSDKKWGDPVSYHLTVNTTGIDIDAIVPAIADYVKGWFDEK